MSTSAIPRRLSSERIARAAAQIDPVFLHTPQYEAEALGAALGVRVIVKVETANPIRSFKGRGTDFFVRELSPRPEQLVTSSAGNFGQGLAYAARKFAMRCDIFAAATASPLKVERMRALGADVHLVGRDLDEAKAHAREYAASVGAPFVEDGREPAIAEGAGSIAVELCRWPQPLAAVVVPLGNGALAGGMGTWIKDHSPATRVIAACAHGAPSMERSWRAGRPIETDEVATIADGIAVRVPIPEAVDDLRGTVDDVVLVSEEALRRAVRLLLETTGLVVEPAGAAGVAALIEHRDRVAPAGMVATVLCGGNLALEQLSALLSETASKHAEP